MARIVHFVITMVAAIALGASCVAPTQPPPTLREQGRFFAPSVGPICAYAFFAVASEAGRRCPSKQKPTFHSQLEVEIGRLGEHIARSNGVTPDQVAKLRRDQGNVDAPDEHVCSEFPLGVWQGLQELGTENLRRTVDEFMARPRPAEWGDCL